MTIDTALLLFPFIGVPDVGVGNQVFLDKLLVKERWRA
jgi:hypothetical protein